MHTSFSQDRDLNWNRDENSHHAPEGYGTVSEAGQDVAGQVLHHLLEDAIRAADEQTVIEQQDKCINERGYIVCENKQKQKNISERTKGE